MWEAANACAPHPGRARSKRQSTIAQSGSPRCRASSAGSIRVVGIETHFRRHRLVVTIASTTSGEATMAIEVYWGSGSPFAWRVLLALEHKRLPYTSHVLQFSKQEHQSPQMLALNWRGKVPVLKDGDYVCFESLAVLYYLDLKYPEPPIFGRTPEEAGVIMRVICEYQAYIEPHLITILNAVFGKQRLDTEQVTEAMHHAASE